MTLVFTILTVSLILNLAGTAAQEQRAPSGDKPEISLPEDMSGAVAREVDQVKEDIQKQARSLFEKTPLGWDRTTIDYLAG